MNRVSLTRFAEDPPEMWTLEEVEEFNTICKQIDSLSSRNKMVGAERKLRQLIKKVLDSGSDQTSQYLMQIHERWGWRAKFDSLLEAHLAKCGICEGWIDLIRFKFRDDPVALDFISEVESECEQIDPETAILGSRFPNLIRAVVDCTCGRRAHGQRSLSSHLLSALEFHYRYRVDVYRYVRRLRVARARLAREGVPLTFEERLDAIRHQFRGDRVATDFISYFTGRIAYIECRLAKDDLAVGRDALMALGRTIVERCLDNSAHSLRWELLRLLTRQYRSVLDVLEEACRLMREINSRT